MTTWRIRLSLFLNYFLFAILLNSVGTIILQAIHHYHITKSHAGNLDAYKDLSIVLFAFIGANFLPRIGYKKSMLIGLGLVAGICFCMPLYNHFWMIKLLLITTGLSFALIKVSIYAVIGLITDNEQAHVSFTSTLEGMFMLGMLSGYWIFGFFLQGSHPHWLSVFWLLGGIAALAFFLLATTPLNERNTFDHQQSVSQDFVGMVRLIKRVLIMLFAICVYIYVFIEQGISTWLPTFNYKTLHLSAAMSIEVTSIFAGALCVGRLLAGLFLKRMRWCSLLMVCLLISVIMVVSFLPHAVVISTHRIIHWQRVPWRAYAFPFIGLLLAPIYPTLCSTILSAFPKENHSAIMGLIMVFSALGGTLGSKLIGILYGAFGGHLALTLLLVPLGLLFILLFPYQKLRQAQVDLCQEETHDISTLSTVN